ncbi:hypothetical protein ACWEO8_12930 [Streptomyces albidoflavus]
MTEQRISTGHTTTWRGTFGVLAALAMTTFALMTALSHPSSEADAVSTPVVQATNSGPASPPVGP